MIPTSRPLLAGLYLLSSVPALLSNAHASTIISCIQESDEEVDCSGTLFKLEADGPLTTMQMISYSLTSAFLVLFAGLMSGLTIGLMSLDLMNLHILEQSGTEKQRRYAARIIPVVTRHHWVLVTLLLSNAAAMEALPLFLDRLAGPVAAVIISVTGVLFFGEVIPQSICSRYSLAIGARTAWFVQLLMILTLPISFPIAKLLDFILGEEHVSFMRRAELKELVTMHAAVNQGPLTLDEITIIKGALDMKNKVARDIFTPIEDVFMLDINAVLDKETMELIVSSGYSRVPVFAGSRQNVLGALIIKMLIVLNYQDRVPIRELQLRPLPIVAASTPLYHILNQFQLGKSHMALVRKDDSTELLGIITMEDVFEELIQEEIVDETDRILDIKNSIRIAQLMRTAKEKERHANNPEHASLMSVVDHEPVL